MTNPNITPELERAARAMYEAESDGDRHQPWDKALDYVHERYRRRAIACLRSLLPPSEGMVEAVYDADIGDWDQVGAAEIFPPMIQHVLGEGMGG